MKHAPASAMGRDPRSIVTPDAFSVTPDLLGTPLGAPWRRLVALLLDLVIIGFLQLLGWRILGGVAALMLLRMATRRADGTTPGPLRKAVVGCAGFFVLIIAVGVTSLLPSMVRGVFSGGGEPPPPVTGATVGGGNLTLGAALEGLAGAGQLAAADDEDEALDAAMTLGRALRSTGLGRNELETSIEALVEENTEYDGEALAARVSDVLFAEETVAPISDAPPRPPLDEALRRMAVVVAADEPRDSGAARLLVDQIRDSIARDTLAALERRVGALNTELDAAETGLRQSQAALAEAESQSTLFTWIRDAADEAGLIFGWGTVYLTLFLALWDGRTPGKKAMDLRVVRLNGQPLGLYLSLERAGGYAAGVATGLLGFAQVWWDPNRQAIHDKIAETVVVREGLPRVPGDWNPGTTRDRPGPVGEPDSEDA